MERRIRRKMCCKRRDCLELHILQLLREPFGSCEGNWVGGSASGEKN